MLTIKKLERLFKSIHGKNEFESVKETSDYFEFTNKHIACRVKKNYPHLDQNINKFLKDNCKYLCWYQSITHCFDYKYNYQFLDYTLPKQQGKQTILSLDNSTKLIIPTKYYNLIKNSLGAKSVIYYDKDKVNDKGEYLGIVHIQSSELSEGEFQLAIHGYRLEA